jgi:hypothetical protein
MRIVSVALAHVRIPIADDYHLTQSNFLSAKTILEGCLSNYYSSAFEPTVFISSRATSLQLLLGGSDTGHLGPTQLLPRRCEAEGVFLEAQLLVQLGRCCLHIVDVRITV